MPGLEPCPNRCRSPALGTRSRAPEHGLGTGSSPCVRVGPEFITSWKHFRAASGADLLIQAPQR